MRKRTAVPLALISAIALALALAGAAVAAEVSTYVGCSTTREAPAAEECEIGDQPGAFFESDVEIKYDICVEFPSEELLCAEDQSANAEVLYVNAITTGEPGWHYVYWFLSGTTDLLGAWAFEMHAAPTPLPPPVVPALPPAITPTIAGPSQDCLAARKRVRALAGRLGGVGKRQKASIRARLKKARATAKKLC